MAGDPGFWDVAWNWPLPFVTAVAVLAVPMAGIIWFICQLRYKQQIATLKDRVELADERLGDAKAKIVKAEEEKTALHTTVKELNAQIEKLKKRKAQLPRELQSIVDRLATSSATASNQVSKLSEAQEAVAAAVSKPPPPPHQNHNAIAVKRRRIGADERTRASDPS
jgi:septal ring factor EnvC (AmiA/AmiB activator)